MAKWADYAIRCRSLDRDGSIASVRAFPMTDGFRLQPDRSFTRNEVVSSIERGTSFVTTYKTDQDTLRKGEDVHVVSINGRKYIRTDANRIAKDNLGNLPDC